MPTEQTLHLVKMANQIAANIDGVDERQRAQQVLVHIRKFWAPSMRDKLCAALADPEVSASLDPLARQALEGL